MSSSAISLRNLTYSAVRTVILIIIIMIIIIIIIIYNCPHSRICQVLLLLLLLIVVVVLSAICLSPGGSCYFTCIQNMKLVTNKFKSGGLHEKHVVATGNFGNHLSICL